MDVPGITPGGVPLLNKDGSGPEIIDTESPPPPTADFEYSRDCNVVTVTDLSTPVGCILSWSWYTVQVIGGVEQTPANATSAQNPVFTFAQVTFSRTYRIYLTVTGTNCCTDTVFMQIVVPGVCPLSGGDAYELNSLPSTLTCEIEFEGCSSPAYCSGLSGEHTLTRVAGACNTEYRKTVNITELGSPVVITVTIGETLCSTEVLGAGIFRVFDAAITKAQFIAGGVFVGRCYNTSFDFCSDPCNPTQHGVDPEVFDPVQGIYSEATVTWGGVDECG